MFGLYRKNSFLRSDDMKKTKTGKYSGLTFEELVNKRMALSDELSSLDITSNDYSSKIDELSALDSEIDDRNFELKQEETLKVKERYKSFNKEKKQTAYVKLTDKAKEVRLSPRTLKNWIKIGKVKGKKMGIWFVEDFYFGGDDV